MKSAQPHATLSPTLITGASGYLGSAVRAASRPTPVEVLKREPENQESRTGNRLVLCHGVLRDACPTDLHEVNVLQTDRYLRRVDERTPVLLASSRFADVPNDAYGASKRRAEDLVTTRHRRSLCLRMWVLAGPSPAGPGRSFLAQMIRDAIHDRTISIPSTARRVSVLDVRQAAAALATAVVPSSPTTMLATGEAADTDTIAERIALHVERLFGFRPRILRRDLPPPQIELPESDPKWLELLRISPRVEPIPLDATIRDTIELS